MDTLDEILEHHGIKGMRWGVRNDHASGGSTKSPKMSKLTDASGRQLTKADAKWVRSATSMKKGIETHNRAAQQMNNVHIPRINAKPQYKRVDVTKDTPLTRKYLKEMDQSFAREFNKAAKDVFGDSPSGRYKVSHVQNNGLPAWTIDYATVKHDALPPPPKLDVKIANGKVVSCSVVFGGSMIHDNVDSMLSEILEHHGIKGMRWGVRKDRSSGGSGHTPSSDAARAKELHAQAKKKGMHTLSNQELQHLTQRMNLEQQYSRLSPPSRTSAGAKFAREFLISAGKQQAQKMAAEALSKAVANAMHKK